jgi:hypothetical protein
VEAASSWTPTSAGRDLGVRLDGEIGRVSYEASVTNGPGLNESDENGARSYSARAGYAVRDDIVVFGQVGLHDYVDASGIEFGTWLDRWHVRAGVLAGDNWQLLDPASLDPASFLTGQAIVMYYYALGNERVAGVEPLMDKDRRGANLDVCSPEVGDTELSLKAQSTLFF